LDAKIAQIDLPFPTAYAGNLVDIFTIFIDFREMVEIQVGSKVEVKKNMGNDSFFQKGEILASRKNEVSGN
jgi:hypothetical protein